MTMPGKQRKSDPIYINPHNKVMSEGKSSSSSISLEDFKLVKFISKSQFSQVVLAHHPQMEKYFAIKCISRTNLSPKDIDQKVQLEKLIMLDVDHSLIVNMHYVFYKNDRIYFVMDYIRGGSIFNHLQIKRRLTENQVKFIATQTAMALGYLHQQLNVIYRDLKAENILIDEYGYIKLSDFGLSKQAHESNTFCGTPEYLSPEMLQGTTHDKTTDWWAFGILIYEMLAGIPPFYDENHSRMFKKILEGEIPWPDKK